MPKETDAAGGPVYMSGMPHIDLPGPQVPMVARVIGWTLLFAFGTGVAWRLWQAVA